ncbi:peptidylprolyl isomerase [Sulfuricaulis limicola]|uniref:peptidylprolyl isomerase n=1 Tax=Sulfuricaulis limicola TaxID=1620215 RepID=A0A1B4XJU3_9GAMM|nr:peptidylprolyl isomerase [Sulfuricaulis limicola]BAV35063.1 peptidylprolyl isomerase [Sulfuricaulis limicola]
MTAVVAKNKVISLIYVVRNEKGEIFEYRDLPVSYVHGSGTDLFPKIEQALEGRAVGDRVAVQLTPADAFGDRDPKLTFTDDIENAPPELRRVGAEFEAQNAKGESIMLTVTRIEGDRITVDANHPLAGQNISFEVTVQDIRDATPEEIRDGRPAGDLPTLQ